MRPKIISIGTAFPPNTYTQRQVFDALQYPRPFWRIFNDAQIDTRHFWVPLGSARDKPVQQMMEAFLEGAVTLGKEAVTNCLDGRSPECIGSVTWVSCTGYLCPGPAHHIAQQIPLNPKAFFTTIQGMGCDGGFPGLKRACDHVRNHGTPALVVDAEICSATYFPEPPGQADPENDYELLRGCAIFGDAAAAVLVGYDSDPRHPEIIDFASYTNPDHLNDLGYVWRDGRLRLLLSKRIPELAPSVAVPAASDLLQRNWLYHGQIAHWIIHAGGAKVINNIALALDLTPEQTHWAREALRQHGNTSSTSIALQGKLLIENADIRSGDYCVVVSLGPGLTGGATLLRWS